MSRLSWIGSAHAPPIKLNRPQPTAAHLAVRWAGREKVALISFGYQNIFATCVSFDSDIYNFGMREPNYKSPEILILCHNYAPYKG
jgi:hypothetical protein